MNGLQQTEPPISSRLESSPVPSEARRHAWYKATDKMASDFERCLVRNFFGSYQIPIESDRQKLIVLILNAQDNMGAPEGGASLLEAEGVHFLSLLHTNMLDLERLGLTTAQSTRLAKAGFGNASRTHANSSSSASSSNISMPLPQLATTSTLSNCLMRYVTKSYSGDADTTQLLSKIFDEDLRTLEQCDYQAAADLMLAVAGKITEAKKWEQLERYSADVLDLLKIAGVAMDIEPYGVVPKVVDILLALRDTSKINDTIASQVWELQQVLENAAAINNSSAGNVSTNIGQTMCWPKGSVPYSAPQKRNVVGALATKESPNATSSSTISSSSTSDAPPPNWVARRCWANYVRLPSSPISTDEMFTVSTLFNHMGSLEQYDIPGLKQELYAQAKNSVLAVQIFSDLATVMRTTWRQNPSIDPTEMMPHLFEILSEFQELKDISHTTEETNKKIRALHKALDAAAQVVSGNKGAEKVIDTANSALPTLSTVSANKDPGKVPAMMNNAPLEFFWNAGSDSLMPSFDEPMNLEGEAAGPTKPDVFPLFGMEDDYVQEDRDNHGKKRVGEQISSPQPQKKIKLESGLAQDTTSTTTTTAATLTSTMANSANTEPSALQQQLLGAVNVHSVYFAEDAHLNLALKIIQALALPSNASVDSSQFRQHLKEALLKDNLYSSNAELLTSMARSYGNIGSIIGMDTEEAMLFATFFSQLAEIMSELGATRWQ